MTDIKNMYDYYLIVKDSVGDSEREKHNLYVLELILLRMAINQLLRESKEVKLWQH